MVHARADYKQLEPRFHDPPMSRIHVPSYVPMLHVPPPFFADPSSICVCVRAYVQVWWGAGHVLIWYHANLGSVVVLFMP